MWVNGAAMTTTYRTDVFAQYGAQADAEIDRIIAQNMVPARGAQQASHDAPRPLAKREADAKGATSQRAG